VQYALRMQAACVFCGNYCHHCLPCPEGIEIGWVIWDLDQIPARGIEQVAEWYAEFPVKASAAPRSVWASSAGYVWSAARLT
jgi:predicted aldo/keto reductase-like oxidoreductase